MNNLKPGQTVYILQESVHYGRFDLGPTTFRRTNHDGRAVVYYPSEDRELAVRFSDLVPAGSEQTGGSQ